MTEQRKASDSSRAAKVVLKSDNDDMSVVVACVHIISGQKTRKITGNTPEKRAKFKAACVAHVIDQTFKAAERYPSKAAIICGDFNADLNLVNDAANAVADTRSAVIIGIEKDFIISSWECDDSNSRVVQAHDGAHSAVNAGFAQPRQAPSASKKRSTQSMTTEEPKSKRSTRKHFRKTPSIWNQEAPSPSRWRSFADKSNSNASSHNKSKARRKLRHLVTQLISKACGRGRRSCIVRP